jgi:predicted dehydrogenase
MATKVKVAVLGTGSLGKEHVRIYAQLVTGRQADLVGIFDTNREIARHIASKHRTHAFESVEEAIEDAEAVSIVTPTVTHFELAKQCLELGKHVLIEKPMTDHAEQATELVQLAQEKNCVLQVGHVERFNPVFTYLESVATRRASSKRIASRRIPRAARTSASCWI